METETPTPTSDSRSDMLRRIQQCLEKVERRTRRLQRTHVLYIYTSLIASAIATVLAGLTAAAGPLVGQGPPAWRLTCGAIAVLTGVSGLFTMLHQRLNLPEQVAKVKTCAGRLRALEVGLTVSRREPQEVAKDYEELVATYHEYMY